MTGRRRSGEGGASVPETLVVLALVGLLLIGAGLSARRAWARELAGIAAGQVASEIRLRRSEAVATAIARALLFARGGDGEWTVAVAVDGDGDGIRAEDLRAAIDRVVDGPQAFVDRHGGARLGFHPSIRELRSPPPTNAPLGELDDPVRLGLSDTVSFSPRGSLTSGTLYLTDGTDRQFAVVIYGQTARIRVWEYDLSLRLWRPRF